MLHALHNLPMDVYCNRDPYKSVSSADDPLPFPVTKIDHDWCSSKLAFVMTESMMLPKES